MVTANRTPATASTPFVNQPLTDFTRDENIRAQEAALRQVESELGRTYPLIIGGERRYTDSTFTSINPAHPEQVVAAFAKAGIEEANAAVQAAWETFQTWQYTAAEERAGYLFRAAELMRERRFYFNAVMIYEVSKSCVEADADTAEAIDFLEFYWREAIRYGGEQPLTRIPE
ncbi:MAG: aldehyde dehydrogenase family protein, partial [Ktedonobacterales bacterium]